MKKPKLEDFKREIYDNQDYIDWYMDYYGALEEYVEELEQTNAQFITVAFDLLEALKMCRASLQTYGDHPIIDKYCELAINKAIGK